MGGNDILYRCTYNKLSLEKSYSGWSESISFYFFFPLPFIIVANVTKRLAVVLTVLIVVLTGDCLPLLCLPRVVLPGIRDPYL